MDFINNFELSNLKCAKTILHKKIKKESYFGSEFSKIPNIGFVDINKYVITNIPMEDYISPEDFKELLPISSNGHEIQSKHTYDIFKTYESILKKFKTPCNTEWNSKLNNSWFWVNFFPSDSYNPKLNKSPPRNTNVKISSECFIKRFSTEVDGCSIENIRKINKFHIKTHKSAVNSFGKGEVTPHQRYQLYTIIIKNPTIQMSEIVKLMGNEVSSDKITNELNKIKKFKGIQR